MSKSKAYKKKSNAGSNIFVILAIILVVLIVAAVVFTSIDNSKYNNLLEDYTEHEYGERQNVKLTRGQDATTGVTLYASDEYAYYVDDNIIYDLNKNTAENEAFSVKAGELSAELGTVGQMIFQTHTDGSDFTKDYDYVEVSASYDGVLGGTEAAAEKIWNFVSALNDEYNICGMYFTYSDSETLYYVGINTMDKETVTLEKIKESIAEIKLSADATEVTDGEGETVEGDTAEGDTTVEGEEAPAEGETENTDGEAAE